MNKLNRKQLFSSLALLYGLALGCGDGGGSGGSSGKKLSSLSDSESQALCKEFAKKVSDLNNSAAELECVVEGLLVAASSDTTCATARDACVANLVPEEPDYSDCTDLKTEDSPACASELTLGEFRNCIDAAFDVALKAFEGLSCESSLEDYAEPEEPTLPAECDVVAKKCPELLPS